MRSLRQRVSLSLHPDDLGEIIRHRAESIEHRVEFGRPFIIGGPFFFEIPLNLPDYN